LFLFGFVRHAFQGLRLLKSSIRPGESSSSAAAVA
jgi:hypothetical protein